MKISQSIASTLLVAVTEAIQGGAISQYGSVTFDSDWEHSTLNALEPDFVKSLARALDGSTLESFVIDQLRRIRVQTGAGLPENNTSLSKITCFADPLKTAREVIKNLSLIPQQYRLVVRISSELADLFSSADIEIKLSERLTIISGGRIPASFRTTHENAALDKYIRRSTYGAEKYAIIPNALYLQYRTSAYLATRRQSRSVSEFYDEVRAFYGACIAHGILSEFPGWGDDITTFLVGSSIEEGAETFAYIERTEDDIVRCANLSTSEATDDAVKANRSLQDIMKPIMPVFESDNSTKLKTACSWALRAHLSNRGLDKILESAIAIEVLMGDRDTSDRIGLSKLIANRCAYALGESNRKRTEMIDFFVKFYKVRSEVVHSGRTALEPNERKIVNEGLALATQILKHEILLAR